MLSAIHRRTTLAFMIVYTIGSCLNALSQDQEIMVIYAQHFADNSYIAHLPSLHQLADDKNQGILLETAKNSCYSMVSHLWNWGISDARVKKDFLKEWDKIEHHRKILIDEGNYSSLFRKKAARPLATLTLLACKTQLILESLGEHKALYMGKNISFQNLLSQSIYMMLEQLKENIAIGHQKLDHCINKDEVYTILNTIASNEIMNGIRDAKESLYHLFNVSNSFAQEINTLEVKIKEFNDRKEAVFRRIERQENQAEQKRQKEIREKERKIAQLQEQENRRRIAEQEAREERARLQREAHHRKEQERIQQEYSHQQAQLKLNQQLDTIRKKLNNAIANNDLPLIEQLIREAQRLNIDSDQSVDVAREFLSEARRNAQRAAHGEYMQNQEEIHVSRTQVEKDMHKQLQREKINIDYIDRLISQARSQGITANNSSVTRLMIDRIRDTIVEEIENIMYHNNMQRLTYLVEKALMYGLQNNPTVQKAIAIVNSQTNASAPPAPTTKYKIIECESCYDDFSAQELYICPKSGCHIKFCPDDLKDWIQRSQKCPICREKVTSISSLKKCSKNNCGICHEK